MSRCEDLRPYLDAYADGELPDEGVFEMQAHLSECAECAKEVQLIEKVTAALLDEERYEINGAFVDACMEKIGKITLHPSASAGFQKYKKTVTALAAAAGLVGLTFTAGFFIKRSAPGFKKAG